MMIVRFALEGVVEIRAFSAEQCDQGRNQISRNEQRSPALGLFDVDSLVGTRGIEQKAVATEDDVAEGHGAGAAFEEGAARQEPGDDAAVNFEDAIDEARSAAGEEREG